MDGEFEPPARGGFAIGFKGGDFNWSARDGRWQKRGWSEVGRGDGWRGNFRGSQILKRGTTSRKARRGVVGWPDGCVIKSGDGGEHDDRPDNSRFHADAVSDNRWRGLEPSARAFPECVLRLGISMGRGLRPVRGRSWAGAPGLVAGEWRGAESADEWVVRPSSGVEASGSRVFFVFNGRGVCRTRARRCFFLTAIFVRFARR